MGTRERLFLLVLCAALVACGGGASSSGAVQPGVPGTLLEKPGGGSFFLDEHRAGTRSRLQLVRRELATGSLCCGRGAVVDILVFGVL